MSSVVLVDLLKIGPAKYQASNASGYSALLDGPPSLGGASEGLRPMELILMGLAGCTSFDVQSILQKQRLPLSHYKVSAEGTRSDETPAVYTSIVLIFEVNSEVQLDKLEKAVSLSLEKYCSVAAMLRPGVSITYRVQHKA